jgi:thymidylate kinase
MTQPKLFIVTGISGSGKTTIARQLVKNGEVAFDSKLNPDLYQFIDKEGNVARTIKFNDGEWQNRYKWSLNEGKLNELLRRHSNISRVFLCGRANLFQYWDKADRILLLRVDKKTLKERLNNKSRNNLFAKDKVTQDRLLDNLDSVQYKIIEKGGVPIDATVSIDGVVEQILHQVELR